MHQCMCGCLTASSRCRTSPRLVCHCHAMPRPGPCPDARPPMACVSCEAHAGPCHIPRTSRTYPVSARHRGSFPRQERQTPRLAPPFPLKHGGPFWSSAIIGIAEDPLLNLHCPPAGPVSSQNCIRLSAWSIASEASDHHDKGEKGLPAKRSELLPLQFACMRGDASTKQLVWRVRRHGPWRSIRQPAVANTRHRPVPSPSRFFTTRSTRHGHTL
jgi:hypothetical protein